MAEQPDRLQAADDVEQTLVVGHPPADRVDRAVPDRADRIQDGGLDRVTAGLVDRGELSRDGGPAPPDCTRVTSAVSTTRSGPPARQAMS